MAKQLSEMENVELEEGKDVAVINAKIKVEKEAKDLIFEILLWILGIIPGIIFMFVKISKQKYFDQLQQKIQHAASEVDNYLEQRVVILSNAAALVEKAVKLDKETFTEIAKLRGGKQDTQEGLVSADKVSRAINVQLERYPELAAHKEIADAMQHNSYLQREITAARTHYNDNVTQWNRDIFAWPACKIVAAKNGYSTMIPFVASKEVKAKAKGVFF